MKALASPPGIEGNFHRNPPSSYALKITTPEVY